MVSEVTDEQQMLIELARNVGSTFGLEYWHRKDLAQQAPREAWSAICEAGIGGLLLPEAYGGGDGSMVDLSLAVEELAAAGAGSTVGQLFMINPIFCGVAVSRYGTPAMREEVLRPLAQGRLWACMALTEADAGSNTLEITTRADSDGDGWRLHGSKTWITAVPEADKMLVIARTLPIAEVSRRTEGISMFMIDADRAGVTATDIPKAGTRTLSANSVHFDDVQVHAGELIGTEHGGWTELLDVLNTERMVTTAGLVGTGRLATRLAVDYANERIVFGDRPISSYQGLQFPLATAYAELRSARLMNLDAAERYDRGQPCGEEANIAKFLAARASEAAIDRSMQTMGGMGYAVESHLERLWRDARLFRFAPVSEEMILNFLAVHCLGMERSY